MIAIVVLLIQASLPPSGLHYYARTDFKGPGLVCGAAFSIRLTAGETAFLAKRSMIDGQFTFHTRTGNFSIRETQYTTEGGTIVRRVAEGILRRKREGSRYIWTYRDSAPGSTDIYGPGVDHRRPSPALNRIKLGSPSDASIAGEECLGGNGSDQQPS